MSSTHTNRVCQDPPSLAEIRTKTTEAFGRRPCLWQIKVTQAILRREKDVICIAATGAGKTLSFWMPLLFSAEGVQVVITPLNILGSQNKAQLKARGIRAISIDAKTSSGQNIQDIEDGKYRVVVVNPEIAFAAGSRFERVWKNERFASRIISVIWDEAHCVSTWSSFRKEYADAGRLRYLISHRVPYLIPSATLPTRVMADVMKTLRVHQTNVAYVLRSNDRPNVYISVRKIKHALKSFLDLDFLVPKDWQPGQEFLKFLVFFDNIQESVDAAKTLAKKMPQDLRKKLVWFNSDMTAGFREWATAAFKENTGEDGLYGLFCTDSFGMGVDIPDIKLVVQWRVTCDLNTLWQRFGRAARAPGTEAVAVLLAEGKYFDDEKEKALRAAEARARKAAEQAARREIGKRKSEGDHPEPRQKRIRRGEPRAEAQEIGMDVDEESAVPDGVGSHNGMVREQVLPSIYEELRITYACTSGQGNNGESTKAKGKKTARKDIDISAEMDNLINANSRPFKCYRIPIMAYYENDRRVSDHLECERAGCKRCHLPPSTICCELCNSSRPAPSDIFIRLAPHPVDPTPAPELEDSTRLPRPSRLAKFAMTPADYAAREALETFRCDKMAQFYGRAKLRNLGPGTIMSDDILTRIADCARLHKLSSMDDLRREVPKWRRITDLGDEVLKLVERLFPKPQLYTTAPLQSRQNVPSASGTTANSTSSAKGPTVRKCGACGNAGHNRRTCPVIREQISGTNKNSAPANTSMERTEPQRVPHSILDSLISTPSYRQVPPRILTPAEIAAAIQARAAANT